MPKTLMLLRHAKTMPDEGSGDHDRRLMARGQADAPAMGREIARRGYAPALVLCSSARRTQETLELVRPYLQPAPTERVERGLYLAEAATILGFAARLDEDTASVLFIGHNPGLEELAFDLADETPVARRIGEKFPTSAFAAFESSAASWQAAAQGTWVLRDLIYPADL